jgi:hypothetical protein
MKSTIAISFLLGGAVGFYAGTSVAPKRTSYDGLTPEQRAIYWRAREMTRPADCQAWLDRWATGADWLNTHYDAAWLNVHPGDKDAFLPPDLRLSSPAPVGCQASLR